jgi:hypothetical protein
MPSPPTSVLDEGSAAVWVDLSSTSGDNKAPVYLGSDGVNTGEARYLRYETTKNSWDFIGFGADVNSGTSSNSGYEFMTITWNTSGEVDIYRDDANNIGSGTVTLNTASSPVWYYGRRYDTAADMVGEIDDPRIYDKKLTATEVSNLYNTGSISG